MNSNNLSQIYAKEVKNEVDKRGISIGYVEKMSGLSPGYISRCRKGNRHMSLESVAQIETFLGIDIFNRITQRKGE